MSNLIRKSVLAGVLVAIAGAVCSYCGSAILGSFLFSVGLIAVILLQGNLYTGKIGYVESVSALKESAIIMAVNLVSAGIVGVIYRFSVSAIDISTRLNKDWYEFLAGSILCGVMIYLAVECYRRSGNLLTIVLPIMAFILGGGEHCVADAFFFAAAETFNWKAIGYLAICVVGNAIGSLAIHWLHKEVKARESITLNIK